MCHKFAGMAIHGFDLSKEPELGTWTIVSSINGDETTKTFLVHDYGESNWLETL